MTAKYHVGSNYLITLYSPSLVRIQYSKTELWDEENPILIEANFDKDEKVQHRIKKTKEFFILTTKYFQLKIKPDGKPFDIGNLFFTIKEKKFTWQPGIVDTENIGGAMLDLYKFPEGKSNEKFTEGLISKNGYFVYRNHCEFLWDPTRNWIKRKKEPLSQDWYLFGYGNDYKRAFSDFIKLFGKIPIPPKWAFGYWYSKWYKFKDTEILEIIKKLKELNIPIDVFVIDTDWRKHTWNGYEWNKELFPDPKIFLDELKRKNIHTCLNDHPGYGQSDELPPDDPYREKMKERIPDIKEYRVRWSDERYVNAWIDEIFTKFLREGIDFWWVDGWGATESPMDLNSQLWLNRFYFEACKKTGDNRRPLILSRWGGIGSHKYPVQFSGDTYSSFETLKYQISFTHRGGNIGADYWSHDIGGFLGKKLPEDLYIRWLQFGCFSPIFRTHSSGGTRDVWDYSKTVLEVFRKYVKIRYALFPYFYTLARECFDKGLPIIRGLYLEYPSDKNSYFYNEEYLIGKYILVAPIYTPGEICEREIYFPVGLWLSLEDKKIIKGPCVKKLKVPLEKIPVFIRKGAIIPSSTVGENLSKKIDEIEFNIFPDRNTEFIYYEDDGLTQEYMENKYLTQKIRATNSTREIKIEIDPAVGNYTGCPSEIVYKLNVFVDRQKSKYVLINGKKSPFKYTKKLLSGTVDSRFNFLYIEPGRFRRNQKIEITIKFFS